VPNEIIATKDIKSYPADLINDISWSPTNYNTVSDIQAAFNNGRTGENSQLGTSIPMLTMPSQAEWDAKSDKEKALWLINKERVDRGVHPLDNTENNIMSVAQNYSDYLIANNGCGHEADGNTPWERINLNSTINACHDFLSIAENIFYTVSSINDIKMPIERAIYNFIYVDISSSFGHRQATLWYPYDDNSGTSGKEGFLGVGRTSGTNKQLCFASTWNYVEVVVLNFFDPCSSWQYTIDNTDIFNKKNHLKIYPNPIFNELNIEINNNNKINYEIFNAIGQTIIEGNFSKSIKINNAKLPKGIYFIKLINGNEILVNKIIKE